MGGNAERVAFEAERVAFEHDRRHPALSTRRVPFAGGPVGALVRHDADPYAVAARDSATPFDNAEQLANGRVVFADELTRAEMEARNSRATMRVSQRSENERAAELVDVVAGVASEREDLHRRSLARRTLGGNARRSGPRPRTPGLRRALDGCRAENSAAREPALTCSRKTGLHIGP